MKVNTESWKLFNYTDLFKIKRGYYSKKPEASGDGNIPFLGASDSNNGVTCYLTLEEIESNSKSNNDPLNKKLCAKNAICVNNNGSVGYAYYQPQEFTCSSDVNVLYRKDGDLNEYTGLFLTTIIMKDRYRWGYGRKWSLARMKASQIKLPATIDGKPDWEYMEKFIKSLSHKRITTKLPRTDIHLDASDWQPFLLHEIFHATMGNGIDAVLTSNDNPKYNYITRGSSNNGIADVIDEMPDQELFPAGAITLALGGSLGSCFVQPKPFYTGQNTAVLQEKVPLSIYTKLFLVTIVINECKIKYYPFGRELNSHFRKDFVIKLPVQMQNGKPILDETQTFSTKGYIPDWQQMENIFKKLQYSDRIL